MNPIVLKTVGRLPVFRSVVQRRADARARADDSRREHEELLRQLKEAQRRTAHEPDLVPPPEMLAAQGIQSLEEWYRWGEEWSVLLRVYGNVTTAKSVLEIGSGLGRVAFPLRYVLGRDARYEGLEFNEEKVGFVRDRFARSHPNFNFTWGDVRHARDNPDGKQSAAYFRFPYDDGRFDLVFAASVCTHLLPDAATNLVQETARVLAPGGRAVFSFFLLDHYAPDRPRPLSFANPVFNVEHPVGNFGDEFRAGNPREPEAVAAYRTSLVEKIAGDAGLRLAQPPVPGMWSGAEKWVGTQDLVILEHAPAARARSSELSYMDRL